MDMVWKIGNMVMITNIYTGWISQLDRSYFTMIEVGFVKDGLIYAKHWNERDSPIFNGRRTKVNIKYNNTIIWCDADIWDEARSVIDEQ